MEVKTFLNVNESDVHAKKFNIFIGISLGNKYFSRENIKDYILWSLENTKDRVAILIPDKIHSINYEVKNGYSKDRADSLSSKEGEKVRNTCESIIAELDEEKRASIKILKWEDIETDEHKKMVAVLHRKFDQNNNFRNLILEIVKENVQDEGLSEFDYGRLASYPIEELPMLISGIGYEGIRYDLLPYPGISKIDHLALDLQEGKSFPETTKELKIKSRLGLVEAYANL